MSFERLGLRPELIEAVKTRGYSEPTPIQVNAVPVILEGRDIMAQARTGTGKTDAFGLPMVELLAGEPGERGRSAPRALVLVPTRELALQVGDCVKGYARRVSLRCTVVYGGVRIEPQIERLKRGVDILVGTPGRLLDLVYQKRLDLSRIGFLVFDEADRMLDLGFSREINAILERVPTERQTLLFSATYTQDIRALAAEVLNDPAGITVSPDIAVAEPVIQKVHRVAQANKRDLLVHLISTCGWDRALVFTRTIHGANRLTERLQGRGIKTAALHSSKSQSVRTRTLELFKNGEIRVLVATDVAARGLDITGLPCVVNFDMPNVPEDYVHRIGRTGRAGVTGLAVSLVSPEEKRFLEAIEKRLGQTISVEKIEGFTEGCDVPDFVLYRPGSATSEKKASREIKNLVRKREEAKNPAAESGKKGTLSTPKKRWYAEPGKKTVKPAGKAGKPGPRARRPK